MISVTYKDYKKMDPFVPHVLPSADTIKQEENH